MFNLSFMQRLYYFKLLCFVLLLLPVNKGYSETINVAVASNALATVKYVANIFSKKTGHIVRISSGSTGKLYSQIVNGAPYDIFMAANEREPMRLENENRIVRGTRNTYALGRLVLLSSDSTRTFSGSYKENLDALLNSGQSRLSIANPRIAPYGLAAKQALETIALWNKFKTNIIQGENINQAFQFVVSGNVELGIVSMSQVKQYKYNKDQYLVIPATSHEPIKQQIVILKRAETNKAAKEFLDFLMSDDVGQIFITRFGYGREKKSNT